mgnify:CR=1 FL=1
MQEILLSHLRVILNTYSPIESLSLRGRFVTCGCRYFPRLKGTIKIPLTCVFFHSLSLVSIFKKFHLLSMLKFGSFPRKLPRTYITNTPHSTTKPSTFNHIKLSTFNHIQVFFFHNFQPLPILTCISHSLIMCTLKGRTSFTKILAHKMR